MSAIGIEVSPADITFNEDDRAFVTARIVHEDGHWLWKGRLNVGGYAQTQLRNVRYFAHRLSYLTFKGPIPEGYTIDHLCRVRHCMNPEHLEAVTLRINLLRGNTFQSKNAHKTECVNGHPYTPENTIDRGHGWRRCRTCRMASGRRSDAKRRGHHV